MGNTGKRLSRPMQMAIAVCSVLSIVAGAPSASTAGQFRAAVVKTDMTPSKSVWLLGYDPRQSTGVHDRLYLRIVAMDDGNTQFFLIASTTPNVRLRLAEEVSETPRKSGMGWAADLGKYTRTTSAGQTMVRLPLRFLEINDDIAIWAAPIELFCEIEMRISDRSPFPFTLHFGYANGMLDYFPTKAEFAYGGYEPGVSPFTEQGEGDLIRAVLAHLQGASR